MAKEDIIDTMISATKPNILNFILVLNTKKFKQI